MSGQERTEILRALVSCDGAVPPSDRLDEGRMIVPVASFGPSKELNLHVTELGTVVLERFSPRANDLVRIAAYVFAADQLLSRGGNSDPHRRRWRRDMAMVVPVLDPDFWSQPSVLKALEEALAYGTEDYWSFSFVQGESRQQQLRFDFEDVYEHQGRQPDSVVMFSGGMDSLCAMVEALATGLSPIAVSHRAAMSTASPQRQLVELLRPRFPGWPLPHLSFRVHQRGQEAHERTRRTRGFLFAALGSAVAGQLGIPRVLLSDNGYVSINPPINAQLVGALNSRGTHPAFLRLMNELLALVFPDGVAVENSLIDRTRSEALAILKEHGCTELVTETRSCANSRTSREQPHCGVCSQCVDRRFAVIHAGLEELDPPSRYQVDIFRTALQEGKPKTFALSYVGFARSTAEVTPDDLLFDYPEFDACLDLTGPDPSASAGRIHRVLTQHANEVIDVLAHEVERESRALAKGTLPADCLLLLATGSRSIVIKDDVSLPLDASFSDSQSPSTVDDPSRFREPAQQFVSPRPHDKAANQGSDEEQNWRVLERHPRGWWIRFDEERAFVPKLRGVERIVMLLKQPYQDVPARTLMDGQAPPGSDSAAAGANETGVEVLDRTAIASYRERADLLRAERRIAESAGDEKALAHIDDEMDWLTRVLKSGQGKGTRLRQFPNNDQRARTAVWQSLEKALEHLRHDMPRFEEHLRESLHRGIVCSYEPHDRLPWIVR